MTTDDTTTADNAPDPAQTADTATEEKDWRAEAEKWQALARKHEDRAKNNANAAKELDEFRRQAMTDQERAIDEARQAARAEVLREVGAERVADVFRSAAAGLPVDVDALLDGLDRSRFLDEDGQPDRDAISAWVGRLAPQPTDENTAPAFPDLGQGVRSRALPLNGDPLERALKQKLGLT